jgi:hypothetical protein
MTPDSEHFPTAILPSKPGPLAERWDRLARVLGDPLVVLFEMCGPNTPPDLRFKAAAELLPYRHRRLKPQEDPTDLARATQNVLVQINFDNSSKPPSLVSAVIPRLDPLD